MTRPAAPMAPAGALLLVSAGLLQGCTPVGNAAVRPAPSSLACMREAIRDRLPQDVDDATRHCLASGLIALSCSPLEAWLAGWGKEASDLLGAGDAEQRDLAADRQGRECARERGTAEALLQCCLARARHPGIDGPGASGGRHVTTVAGRRPA
jgi:hypothetical protein